MGGRAGIDDLDLDAGSGLAVGGTTAGDTADTYTVNIMRFAALLRDLVRERTSDLEASTATAFTLASRANGLGIAVVKSLNRSVFSTRKDLINS